MRRSGRPKEYASYTFAATKLAAEKQMEMLLQEKADGDNVQSFSCMVDVSSFHDI